VSHLPPSAAPRQEEAPHCGPRRRPAGPQSSEDEAWQSEAEMRAEHGGEDSDDGRIARILVRLGHLLARILISVFVVRRREYFPSTSIRGEPTADRHRSPSRMHGRPDGGPPGVDSRSRPQVAGGRRRHSGGGPGPGLHHAAATHRRARPSPSGAGRSARSACPRTSPCVLVSLPSLLGSSCLVYNMTDRIARGGAGRGGELAHGRHHRRGGRRMRRRHHVRRRHHQGLRPSTTTSISSHKPSSMCVPCVPASSLILIAPINFLFPPPRE
jgi:hypothetical protein